MNTLAQSTPSPVPMCHRCMYCNERAVETDTDCCADPGCVQLQSKHDTAMQEYWSEEERGASRALLRQWGRHHDNYRFSYGLPQNGKVEIVELPYRRLALAWYTLKALICLNMPRMISRRLPDWVNESKGDEMIDNLAIFNERPYGGEMSAVHTSWRSVAVGRGVMRGWHALIDYDASC